MKKLIKIICICIVSIIIISCESFVKDININPNATTDAPADLILTGAMVNHKNYFGNRILIISNMWSGYMTGIQRQYQSYQNYSIAAGENTALRIVYYQVYNQLKLVIEKYEAINNQLGIGISKVIQAHSVGTAAALYGDIPFSEICNHIEYPNPVFDPQKEVYSGVQKLLDEAIIALNSGIGSLPNETDIFFNGDAKKWIEVAYTLKARFFTETKEYNKAYEEALKGISKYSNSMLGPCTTTAGMRNSIYNHQVTDRAGDVNSENAFLITLLDPDNNNYRGNSKTNEEARFNYYFLQSGTITGKIEPNHLSLGSGDNFTGIIGMEEPEQLVTYQENLLILAESAARTKDFHTALDHLNEFRSFMNSGGYIHPSYIADFPLKYEPYDEIDFELGGIKNSEGLNNNNAILKEILEERYVTFFCQFLGFNDVRRTRKESIGIKLSPSTGDKLPERFLYDEDEITANKNAPSPLPGIFDVTPVNQ